MGGEADAVLDGRGVFVVVAIEVVEESGGGSGAGGSGVGGGGVFAGLFEFVFVFDLDFDLARLSSQHLSSNGIFTRSFTVASHQIKGILAYSLIGFFCPFGQFFVAEK